MPHAPQAITTRPSLAFIRRESKATCAPQLLQGLLSILPLWRPRRSLSSLLYETVVALA